MDLFEDMRLFIAVAHTKSFSEASKTTGTPLSSISRRVTGLEARLGIQLLHRTSRNVALTELGRTYLERARAIVDATSAAEEELRSTAAHPRGRVRVSMPSDFGQQFLTPLLVEYAVRYPDVDLELDLSPRIVDMMSEGFDLAIRIGGQRDSALATRTIARVRAAVFASPQYLETHGTPEKPEDLARHSCLTLVRGDLRREWMLQSGTRKVTVRVSGRAAANNPTMLKRLASSGLGLALVDEIVAVDELETGALVRVLPEWRAPLIPVHAVTPTMSPPKKIRLLLDCLRDHIAKVRERVEKVSVEIATPVRVVSGGGPAVTTLSRKGGDGHTFAPSRRTR